MNKKTLQNITNLSKIIFNESEHLLFIKYITNNKFTDARLMLDNILMEFDLELLFENNTDFIFKYKKCNELESLVMDLIINEIEYEKGKNIKFSTFK